MNAPARRRALTSLRFVTLVVGAGVMVTPFYMVSTSFKPQAFADRAAEVGILDPATVQITFGR